MHHKGSVSDEKPNRISWVGWAVGGCLLTLAVWFFAAFVIFGTMAGDCFPEFGSRCPSDHERNVRVLWVAVAAMGINALSLFVLARAYVRSKLRT